MEYFTPKLMPCYVTIFGRQHKCQSIGKMKIQSMRILLCRTWIYRITHIQGANPNSFHPERGPVHKLRIRSILDIFELDKKSQMFFCQSQLCQKMKKNIACVISIICTVKNCKLSIFCHCFTYLSKNGF